MSFNGILKKKSYRVVNLMSDGECDEGSNWEAILFAAHHGLSNLVNIIDYNKLQSIYSIEKTLSLEPLCEKWQSFGWNVIEINGHDHDEISASIDSAFKSRTKPTCIIANTVKCKGVSFMENNSLWHYRSPQGDEYKSALEEINKEK